VPVEGRSHGLKYHYLAICLEGLGEKKTPAMITDFRMEPNPGLSEYEAVLLWPLGNGHHIPSAMFKWHSLITYPLPFLSGTASPPLYHAYVDQPHHLPSIRFKWISHITTPLTYSLHGAESFLSS